MKVLIDTGKLKDLYSGLGQVSLHFGKALAELQETNLQFTFLVPRGCEGVFGNHVSYIVDSLWNRLQLKFNGYRKYDLLHYLYQDVKNWLRPARLPYMVTLHDLNFLYHKSPGRAQRYLQRLTRLLQESVHICCISQFTASDLQQHVPDLKATVSVIYNGVEDLHQIESAKPTITIPPSFLFTIGVLHPKKNFEQLIDMMPHVQNHSLVIAGNGDEGYKAQLLQRVITLGVQQRVHFIGTVNAQEKKWLYEHCTAFVFTSKAEGFGLPVIEAMQLGKPVLLLNSTSLPEIGSTHAHYWSKDDSGEAMVKKLEMCLGYYNEHPQLFAAMKNYAADFNWEKNANAYVGLYKKINNS
jgi:glycosyltransferase involved in cell wall biosynthesis